MWSMIATWRMAKEEIENAQEDLRVDGSAAHYFSKRSSRGLPVQYQYS